MTNLAIKKVNPIKLFFSKQSSKLIPRTKQIAILGTIGKTTTAVCLKAVLAKFKTFSTTDFLNWEGSTNSHSDLASLLLRLKSDKLIFELPIKESSDVLFYRELIRPQIIILTRLSNFLEYGGSEKIDEIEKYLTQIEDKQLIVNFEDVNCQWIGKEVGGSTIFYGFDSVNCHVWAGNMRIINFQTYFELNYGVERVEVRSKLLGFPQVLSMLPAAAVGISMGLSLINIKKSLEKVEPLPHRMQLLLGYSNSLIVDDSYGNDLFSLQGAIEALNQIPSRRRILVLSEIKDLAEKSEKIHRLAARIIYSNKVDLVLLGTGDTKYIADELIKLGFLVERMESGLQVPVLSSKLLKIISRGDTVLVKGSIVSRFGELVKKIAKK